MSPIVVGLVVFVSTFGGALAGNRLRRMLPEHHLDDASKDTVKLGIGLVATMTALVLGLVTASAKSSFDAIDTAVKHTAMDLLTLDRVLARYGPETAQIRGGLQQAVAKRVDMIWPSDSSRGADLDPLDSATSSQVERLADAIRALSPADDAHRSLQSRALGIAEGLLHDRWLVSAGGGTSVPLPFLVVLLFWLTITFASFGLFAPRNSTVIAVLLVCALSVASAVFLILEMDGPFDGLLKVSADPLRYAVTSLNR